MRRRTPFGAALLTGLVLASPVLGQQPEHTIGLGGYYQGFSMAPELGADAASLLLTPVAYSGRFFNALTLDVYAAWGLGQVERAGVAYEINALVDTRVRANYAVGPWGVATLGVSLPTGKETLTSEEAVVASVLSTDLLGFRESTWGQGGAVTPGFAAATMAGSWNLGGAVSYRATRQYEPTSEQAVQYQPGNEFRARVAADRNIGEGGKLTLGASYHNYDTDQLDGSNLYQAGVRARGDVSYTFRSGQSTWSVYAADIWRDQGEAIFSIPLENGAAGDSTLTETVGSQNMLIVGVSGFVPVRRGRRIRPQASLRIQTVENVVGTTTSTGSIGTGSGWLGSIGGDFPLRWGGTDFFPRVMGSYGSMRDATQTGQSLWGGEISLTVRWGR